MEWMIIILIYLWFISRPDKKPEKIPNDYMIKKQPDPPDEAELFKQKREKLIRYLTREIREMQERKKMEALLRSSDSDYLDSGYSSYSEFNRYQNAFKGMDAQINGILYTMINDLEKLNMMSDKEFPESDLYQKYKADLESGYL